MSGGATPVHLSVAADAHRELATGQLTLVLDDGSIDLALTVPAGRCATEEVLPILHGLTDLFVARGKARSEAAGREISCRAGCGTCCRQLVPIAASEARALAAFVAAMPEPRQAAVRARFAAALATLDDHGMLDRISDPGTASADAIGTDYMRIGVPCPFLEAESCSIYHDRPLVCREYLVTSPVEHCAAPSPDTIAPVPLERRPSKALLNAEPAEGWTPLVMALLVAAQVPEGEPTRTGPDILRAIVTELR